LLEVFFDCVTQIEAGVVGSDGNCVLGFAHIKRVAVR